MKNSKAVIRSYTDNASLRRVLYFDSVIHGAKFLNKVIYFIFILVKKELFISIYKMEKEGFFKLPIKQNIRNTRVRSRALLSGPFVGKFNNKRR